MLEISSKKDLVPYVLILMEKGFRESKIFLNEEWDGFKLEFIIDKIIKDHNEMDTLCFKNHYIPIARCVKTFSSSSNSLSFPNGISI